VLDRATEVAAFVAAVLPSAVGLQPAEILQQIKRKQLQYHRCVRVLNIFNVLLLGTRRFG
jgi:hypothetical protein